MKKMNKKGFTLVEIMIVVAIIGLLAAIGIPSFNKARSSAIEKSKQNNIRLVIAAAEQYAMGAGLTNGTVSYENYYSYLKGCDADDSKALNVGDANVFQAPAIPIGDNPDYSAVTFYAAP